MSTPSLTKTSTGYSTRVRMQLIAGAQSLAVAQVGPDFAILKTPVDLEPTRAELVVEIDGNEIRRTVYLPEGARAAEIETRIALN